jgi:superfamily I DNA and/or RNA helicase
MIDEAGQSTEQETWIPIGGLANSKTKVVLCGDPEQLGPVVTVHFTKYYGYGEILKGEVQN